MRTVGFHVMERYASTPLEGFDNFMAFKKVAFFDLSLIVDVIVFERERTIASLQQALLRELSTPMLQVRDRLVIMPIIGTVDSQRANY
jgi:rsbT co-antagonist protein RsbR